MCAHILPTFIDEQNADRPDTAFFTSEIMTRVYPVKWANESRGRDHLEDLEAALHTWMINLPDHLQYHEGNKRSPPAPHILVLHIEYYSALLLLHRAL